MMEESKQYDLLDLGAGRGDSIILCKRIFKSLSLKTSIGIDRDIKKVTYARKKGFNIFEGKISKTVFNTYSCRVISMCDFLEHLPTKENACDLLRSAVLSAKDFVFVRHPSFEKEDVQYLANMGLRLTWYTWRGHPARLQLNEIIRVLKRIPKCKIYAIVNGWIRSIDSEYIVPISSPSECIKYSPILGKKYSVNNFKPIKKHIDILATNKNFSRWDIAKSCITHRLERPHVILYNK